MTTTFYPKILLTPSLSYVLLVPQRNIFSFFVNPNPKPKYCMDESVSKKKKLINLFLESFFLTKTFSSLSLYLVYFQLNK